MPAAFGSYSSWVGHRQPDFPWMQLPTAQFSEPMIPNAGAEAAGSELRGPGAYNADPSTMASRAAGSPHNKKQLAARITSEGGLEDEGGEGGESSGGAVSAVVEQLLSNPHMVTSLTSNPAMLQTLLYRVETAGGNPDAIVQALEQASGMSADGGGAENDGKHDGKGAALGAGGCSGQQGPKVELFAYNRRSLRKEVSAGEHAMPAAWVRGAEAASQAAAERGGGLAAAAQDGARTLLTAGTLAPQTGVLTVPGPTATLGGVMDARRLRAEREAREADEKRQRWEARHGGRAPPPPPPPPAGAGLRASERLFDTEKSKPPAPTGWSSTKPAAPRGGPHGSIELAQALLRGEAAEATAMASNRSALHPSISPALYVRRDGGSGSTARVPSPHRSAQLPEAGSHRAAPQGAHHSASTARSATARSASATARSATARSATARSATARSTSGSPRKSHRAASSASGSHQFRSGSPQRPASARPEQQHACGSPGGKRGGGGHGASANAPPSTRKVKRHPRSLNYYGILHLEPDASDADIRQAYHRLAKAWHPDRNRDERAERTFRLVKRAYEVLADPKTREAFDRGAEVPL